MDTFNRDFFSHLVNLVKKLYHFFWKRSLKCAKTKYQFWTKSYTELTLFSCMSSSLRLNLNPPLQKLKIFSVLRKGKKMDKKWATHLCITILFKNNESRYNECGISHTFKSIEKKILRKDNCWHNQLRKVFW